jgi:heptosyltransferase-2
VLDGATNILVRGLNWIGDAVMSLPTLACLRDSHPGARFTVLAPDWCADIYRCCPDVDAVLELPKRSGRWGMKSELDLIRAIRHQAFEVAVILPNSFHSAIAPFAAGVPRRIGYRTDGRALLLSDGISPLKGFRLHTVLYYRPLLEALGISWPSGNERFGFDIPAKVREETEEILASRGVAAGAPRFGFSPGAAWGPSKRWPGSHFAAAAQLTLAEHGGQALFFGSPGDRDMVEGIIAAAGGIDLAGAFPTLAHLAAALDSCAILLTNDSGPMHLAAALETPVVALFGPTDETVSGPWPPGDFNRIIRAPDCRPCYNPECNSAAPCLARITPEQAAQAIAELLEKRGNRG